MQDVYLTVRMDKGLKADFEKFCGSCGMSVSAAIKLLIAEVIKTQSIPFPIVPTSNSRPISMVEGGEYNNVSINIRLSVEMRDAFDETCKKISGIPKARIIKMFMVQCLDTGKMPF